MKSEKGTNRLTGEQIRTRKNSRIIIRILGLSIAVFGIFAFIGFFTNPEFGPNSPGTWIYLLTALFFGGGLFTLSFFVPKLYLPSEPADMRVEEVKCFRCGSDASEYYRIQVDGPRLCIQCRQSLRCFTLICKEAHGCMAYDVMDLLQVFVAEDSYVVIYQNHSIIHYALVPFGFFAKSTGTEIAAKMNSIVPGGFCVPDKHALSADEIKNCEGFRVLIEYDRSRLASAPASEP